MSQHYSNPEREQDEHALPNVGTFKMGYAYCLKCQSLMQDEDAAGNVHCECGGVRSVKAQGWFYWFCFPGCLPDSEPMGPYKTEAEALADARDEDID